MSTYRSDDEGMRRRAAEAERAKKRARAEHDLDLALARAESGRVRRELERGAEVEAGRDRVARVLGAIALGIGAIFLVALVLVAREPRVPARLLSCLLFFGVVPSAWGVLRLVRGAARQK